MATMDAETIDLNALLSYSLNINFAPLQAHLRASSVQAKEVQGQVAELTAQNELLRGMLASSKGEGGGSPLGEVLELRAALAALAARIDALPPPQFFTWDAEREAMAAAERLAVEASGQALEAKGAALDAAGEATAAGEDARKAAAVAAAAPWAASAAASGASSACAMLHTSLVSSASSPLLCCCCCCCWCCC